MHPKNFVASGNHPVDERRLFEIGHSVQARSDPIAGTEHIPGDLRLYCIHVIHQRRRRENAAQISGSREEPKNQKRLAAAYSSTASACFLNVRDGAD